MTEINIHTIYENVTFEYIPNVLKITWDPTILDVNDIMILERSIFLVHYTQQQKASCCWVDELKRVVDWKSGEVIYFQGMAYREGLLEIIISPVSNGMDMIDKDGYLFIRDFKSNGDGYFINSQKKCDCIYNDLLDEDTGSYILK